jgi:hypothetical protein
MENPNREVGCCVVLKCDWFPESEVIGIAHFRRTWKNRIILDYLAAHPFIARKPPDYPNTVRGVGSALFYFIAKVSQRYGCDYIWGEATANSWKFYKKILDLESVEDLIYAEREDFLKFISRMEEVYDQKTDSSFTEKADAVYTAESVSPPFVGSKTAVFDPVRRLAYRFIDLPYHNRVEIAKKLNLFRQDDQSIPDSEQFKHLFSQAKEIGRLPDLWKLVEEKYGDGTGDRNPFSPPE